MCLHLCTDCTLWLLRSPPTKRSPYPAQRTESGWALKIGSRRVPAKKWAAMSQHICPRISVLKSNFPATHRIKTHVLFFTLIVQAWHLGMMRSESQYSCRHALGITGVLMLRVSPGRGFPVRGLLLKLWDRVVFALFRTTWDPGGLPKVPGIDRRASTFLDHCIPLPPDISPRQSSSVRAKFMASAPRLCNCDLGQSYRACLEGQETRCGLWKQALFMTWFYFINPTIRTAHFRWQALTSLVLFLGQVVSFPQSIIT